MMARSHLPFAMASWWTMAAVLGQPITGYTTLIAGLGGLLPDIDHPESTIGRRVRPISLAISKLFGHRGITHSLLAVIGVGLLAQQFPVAEQTFWLPLCIGYLSHILGDALSASGVPLLYPISRKRFHCRVLPVNSWQETTVVGVFFAGCLLLTGAGRQIWGHAIQVMASPVGQVF